MNRVEHKIKRLERYMVKPEDIGQYKTDKRRAPYQRYDSKSGAKAEREGQFLRRQPDYHDGLQSFECRGDHLPHNMLYPQCGWQIIPGHDAHET